MKKIILSLLLSFLTVLGASAYTINRTFYLKEGSELLGAIEFKENGTFVLTIIGDPSVRGTYDFKESRHYRDDRCTLEVPTDWGGTEELDRSARLINPSENGGSKLFFYNRTWIAY